MPGTRDTTKGITPAATASERKTRLAAALRENLKKRKQQARSRAAGPALDTGSGPGAAIDTGTDRQP